MNFDDLQDDSLSQKALEPKAPPPSPAPASFDSLVSDEDKYGSTGQILKTAAEGALRGGTLGLSDLAETRLGIATPEDIQMRKETNPVTSLGSNILGAGALTGLTGGLAAPLEGAALAGGASKIASAAIGMGAEGAVFGAGNAISDWSLGDPNLTAGKVLADVGLGAIFGAALGAGSSKVKTYLAGRVADVASEANAAAETAEALSSKTPSAENIESPKGSFLSVRDKAIAPELRRISSEYGLSLNNGMTSDNRTVQQALDTIAKGAPTFAANAVRDELEQGYRGATKVVESALDTGDKYGGGAVTKAELGQALKDAHISEISQENAPLDAMFSLLKQHNIHVPVNESESNKLISAIKNMEEFRIKGVGSNIAKDVLENVPNLRNAQEVANYAIGLRGELEGGAAGNKKFVVSKLQDMLNDLYESSVEKAAKNSGLPEEAQSAMLELIDKSKQAKATYSAFKEKYRPLMEQLGAKSGYGFGSKSMIAQLEEMDPEKFAQDLFDKKYSSFNKYYAEKFEPQSALAKQYQKQLIKQKSLNADGTLDPKSVLKQIFGFKSKMGLEPEIRSSIFSPEEIAHLKDMKTYLGNFPESFNPSGTEHTRDFKSFFELGKAATLEARDFGMRKYIEIMGRQPGTNPFILGAEAAKTYNNMMAVQKIGLQIDEKLSSGARSIFSVSDAARGSAIKAGSIISDEGYDKAARGVSNMAQNPSGGLDHLVAQTGDLHNSMPNVVQGMHTAGINAAKFLDSKLPRPNNDLPLSQKFEPSRLQKQKFMNSYHAVNDPLSTLKQIKEGTFTNEALEALTAVHPQLLQQMRKEVAARLSMKKDTQMSYGTKISLAKFLGHPLDANMMPQVIAANQQSLSGPQLGNQQAPKTSGRRGSMAKLDMAQGTQTATRKAETDRE